MTYVIVRSQIDYQNEILAVRSTKKAANTCMTEIAKQMVEDASDTEPLGIDTTKSGEITLTRTEFENEEPKWVLEIIMVEDDK
jgi:hypothetical protein